MNRASQGLSLVEKIWRQHTVRSFGVDLDMLFIDRHILHEMSSYPAFKALKKEGFSVRHPELTLAVEDHIIATSRGRDEQTYEPGAEYLREQRSNSKTWGIRQFPMGHAAQGIAHVVGPEMGFSLPGTTLVCGDSHTCTNGAFGSLAFGIGSSDVTHVLATQTLIHRRPRTMRIALNGKAAAGVMPKDIVLSLIAKLGVASGIGYAVEYTGSYIASLPMDGRMTICNMAVEMGARLGIIAPDEITYAYLEGREYAPKGADWIAAKTYWATLPSDVDCKFDAERSHDVDKIEPQVSWGTSPQDTIDVTGRVPDPTTIQDGEQRAAAETALRYMGLEPGKPIIGLPVQRVFIGSCTNSRLSDLRAAAAIAKSRRVANGVRALVVPGSTAVKHAAECEGLDQIFIRSGFEWHEAGCSMCAGINADLLVPFERCASTSNRNFPGRQGPNGRTHLMSPAMAAAAAVSGRIVDVRTLATGG